MLSIYKSLSAVKLLDEFHTVVRKGHGVSWLVFLLRIYELKISSLQTQDFEFVNSKQETNHEMPCPLHATVVSCFSRSNHRATAKNNAPINVG